MYIAGESPHFRIGKALHLVLVLEKIAHLAAEVTAELVNYVEVYPCCVLME